jgi:elongator complex protein 3
MVTAADLPPRGEVDDDSESLASSTIGENAYVRRIKGPKGNKPPREDPQAMLVRTISDIVAELLALMKAGKSRDINLSKMKQECAKRNGMQGIPRLTQIIAGVPEQYKKQLIPLLRAKPVRTASGIAVVAVMSKPHRCPHIAVTGGVCVYCKP